MEIAIVFFFDLGGRMTTDQAPQASGIDKLETCPICGGTNLTFTLQEEWKEGEESPIECNCCDLIFGLNTRRTPAESAAAWNNRASCGDAAEMLRCLLHETSQKSCGTTPENAPSWFKSAYAKHYAALHRQPRPDIEAVLEGMKKSLGCGGIGIEEPERSKRIAYNAAIDDSIEALKQKLADGV